MKVPVNIESLILVVGVSGAGKASTSRSLSDQGYQCLDNFPVPLLNDFFENVARKDSTSKYKHTAIIPDVSTSSDVLELVMIVNSLKEERIDSRRIKLIFLNAATPKLLIRYSETRRAHPGFDPSLDANLSDSIGRERDMLRPLRQLADKILDTTDYKVNKLREQLKLFLETLGKKPVNTVFISVISFGFKYGAPRQCDLQIDVRFIKNPYWEPELTEKTGLAKEVSDYVFSHTNSQVFFTRYLDLLKFLLPLYKAAGKSYLNIGIGCTGGKHRSVAVAEELCKRLSKSFSSSDNASEFDIAVQHRDIGRE